MESLDRRSVVGALTAGAAAAALAGCGEGQTKGAQGSTKKHRWRCAMVIPKTLPIWGEGVQAFADRVREMSSGRLDIRIYGAGELFPAKELFDQVRAGKIQMGHGAAYYWKGKIPASVFFTSVPFGMNSKGMNAWITAGGGQELWDELYRPFGVVATPMGNTGVQMGGWFRKEIKSIDDFKGLKMRMPGLGGKVINKAGAQEVFLVGGEILTSLQTGVIDATEWIGPYHDRIMGFHKAAKYYYSGGWQEPGSMLELLINRQAWEELDSGLQAIVRAAAAWTHGEMGAKWTARDAEAYDEMKRGGEVELRAFPEEVTAQLKVYAQEVIEEIAASDPLARKIHDHFKAFQAKHEAYEDISELAFAKSVRS